VPAALIAGGSEPVYEPLVKLGPVSRVDRWVDESVEARIRGNPVADRVFYAASALGDHGTIWLILAVLRGLRTGDSWTHTVRTAAAIGIESVLVNGPVKWVFRRERPAPKGVAPLPLRKPRTSSFPSGHATSAFCAAALLSDGDPQLRPFYYALAAVVAWSRVHVRVHYASDVVGGVVIGVILGQVFKRLVPLVPAKLPLTATGKRESPSPAPG
jgi:membrane-associated phospholipid phosphatase